MKITKIFFILSAFIMTACSSDDDAASPSLATSLNQAVTYMESSLPDVNSTSFTPAIGRSVVVPFVSETLENAWEDSGTASSLVTMPGGMGSGCTEPQYNGSTLVPATPITIKEYIGMSLDSNFERCSAGDGASDNYQPTIFGRLSGAVTIIGYLDRFLPRDSLGVYRNGAGSTTLSVDGNSIDVEYNVRDADVTTYYDKALSVQGYLAGTSTQVFSNLMWIRNDSAELNFMFMESGDYHDGTGSNGEDGILDAVTYTILKYNKATGQMAFDYTSDTASVVAGAGANPTSPQLEVFRLFVAGTGDEAVILSYDGDSTAADYTAFAVYGPNGDASTSATASVNYDDTTDDITGNTCVTLPAGTATGATACGAHANALDISGGIGAGLTTIKGYTTLAQVLVGKGFQGGTAASLDWSDTATYDAYLTDGASISVGFSSLAGVLTETDGVP